MALKRGGVLVLWGLLAACTSPERSRVQAPEPPKPPSVLDSACNAAGARFALGQKISARLVDDVKVRSNSLHVRILEVGEPVPLEQNPQRLNLLISPDGEIRAVRCR